MAQEGMTAYCLGLPLTQQRQMTGDEKKALTGEFARLRRNVWLLWMGYALAVVLFLVVAIFWNSAADARQGLLAGICLALTLLGLPVAILLSRDWVRCCRGLYADLGRNTISHYAGELSESVFNENFRIAVITAGFKEGSKYCTLDVLAVSRYLWRVNGSPVKEWIVLEEIELADVPPFAALAAEWLQPFGAHTPQVLGGQRELSIQEKAELQKHARNSWLKPLPLAVGLTAWASLPVLAVILTGQLGGTVFDWIRASVLVAFALTSDVLFILGVIQARRLQADCKEGRVIILQEEAMPDSEEQSAISEDALRGQLGQNETATMEILPNSARLWTEEGKPAAWRKMSL